MTMTKRSRSVSLFEWGKSIRHATRPRHRIDPEQYLDEILRVMPYCPSTRYLELAPKFWLATRAKLRSEGQSACLPLDLWGGCAQQPRRSASVSLLGGVPAARQLQCA
jgi:hypothetical protein